jgi:hypothetical protein
MPGSLPDDPSDELTAGEFLIHDFADVVDSYDSASSHFSKIGVNGRLRKYSAEGVARRFFRIELRLHLARRFERMVPTLEQVSVDLAFPATTLETVCHS